LIDLASFVEMYLIDRQNRSSNKWFIGKCQENNWYFLGFEARS